MSEPVAAVPGLRGSGAPSPRWRHLSADLDTMAAALTSGDSAAATAAAERVRAETLGADRDAEALDLAARASANLAPLAAARGALAGSIRLGGEAIELCLRAEALAGDALRTADVRRGVLIMRAQHLQAVGRLNESLVDLDAAAAIGASGDDHNGRLLAFGWHNTRGVVLLELGEWHAAADEFRAARDVALAHQPAWAVHAYANLGLVLQRTGDPAGGREQLRLARELAADPGTAAELDQTLARMAIGAGELDEAEQLLDRAERRLHAGGDLRRAARCRTDRARILLDRGRLRPARALARRALADYTSWGDVDGQVEAQLVLADSYVLQGRLRRADGCFLAARALLAGRGPVHDLARIDVRRAQVAHLIAQQLPTAAQRDRLLAIALDLAVPAALATDALRFRLPPGPVRERWVAEVARAGLAVALRIVTAQQQTAMAIELLEFACSAAGITAGAGSDAAPAGHLAPPAGSADTAAFALAAAGMPAGGSAFGGDTDLPPRVRALPGGDAAFGVWIDEAERRYGVGVRAPEVVDAW